MHTLLNQQYRIVVEPKNGRIVSFVDRHGGYDLIVERRLAENFRLLLPLPGLESNYIFGKDQRLSSCRKITNGLRLEWKKCGGFDIDVVLWIEFVGEAVHFRCDVSNRTKHKLAEVWYPLLGGFRGLGAKTKATETKLLWPVCYAQEQFDICREFNVGEQLGDPGAERAHQYPGEMSMAWASFYNLAVGRGLYFGAHDPEPRAKIVRVALQPGCGYLRRGNDWPTAKEAGGLPVGLTMNWAFFPYVKPGQVFHGPPIVVQAHAGDWRGAAKLYRQWFDEAIGVVDSSSHWMRKELTTLDTMFLYPEDNLHYRFNDIPRWAKSAAKRGIKSVLISGWQVGGHDRGYPEYSPDPRLGTWEDLRKGIAACHRLGLKVFFFVNMQPVDMSTDWYRKELKHYIVMDPAGLPYGCGGFGMGTLGARANMTRTPLTQMNPEHKRVREPFLGYMKKLAEIGADAVHIDKFMSSLLDFNPRLKRSPDVSHHKAMLEVMDEMLWECRKIAPHFDVSYEGWWDWLMQYSDVTWWAPGPRHSVKKEVFPEWLAHSTVVQPYSYNVVNTSVLHAHALLVGPGNYSRDMDFAPFQGLAKYIAEITRIRAELHDDVSTSVIEDASDRTLFHGKPKITVGGAFARDKDAAWTLFHNRKSNRRCLVLANLGRKSLTATGIRFGAGKKCRIVAPFVKAKESRLPCSVTIPAERVVFILENL